MGKKVISYMEKNTQECLEFYKNQVVTQQNEIQELQEQLKTEILLNTQKDEILFLQSKNAQAGEMLSMIAHQWRQPLNAINASSIKLHLKHEIGSLVLDDVIESGEFIRKQTQNMSDTISHFMEFFKPDTKKQTFTLKEIIGDIDSLVQAQLAQDMITLKIVNEQYNIYSYKKEISHIFLNLIANAKDAFKEKCIKNRVITISAFHSTNSSIILQVKDNAGGIPKNILDKIFNLYFTTKECGKGTGIGLYMSKKITNNILGGDIQVENVDDGAVFTIRL